MVPLYISLISEINVISSVRQYLYDAPISDFEMMVVLLGGSIVEIRNSSGVIEIMLSV